jgi:hypothetical protein
MVRSFIVNFQDNHFISDLFVNFQKVYFVVFSLAFIEQFFANPILSENDEDFLIYGNHFEGDIVLTQDQKDSINGKGGRTGLLSSYWRWPINTAGQVIVPYVIRASDAFCEFSFKVEIIERNKLHLIISTRRTSCHLEWNA